MIRFWSAYKESHITDSFISEDGGGMNKIEKYVNCFLHLKRGITIYGPAPHKLVLILAVIRGIEQKRIKEIFFLFREFKCFRRQKSKMSAHPPSRVNFRKARGLIPVNFRNTEEK